MLILVTYDVNTLEDGGKRRLRHVARACQDFGQRVQYSVFEIEVDPAQWTKLKARLEAIIRPEFDSLRYYVAFKYFTNHVSPWVTGWQFFQCRIKLLVNKIQQFITSHSFIIGCPISPLEFFGNWRFVFVVKQFKFFVFVVKYF